MLYSKLNDSDKYMMKHWIDDYAGGPSHRGERADLGTLLQYWNTAKVNLYKMFGEQFILEREVSFEKRQEDMANEIYSSMHGYGEQPMNEFYQAFYDWYYEQRERKYRWECLMFPESLASNVYHGDTFTIPTPDGKDIKIQEGTKILRVLAKIATAYNLRGFEDFRLGHSRILNQKKLTGQLCLSIHPMDYMTMSDNDCDWDSCMSWRNDGCYRRGTVEMMNSQYVVVAYLKAKEDMRYYDWKWSNKKWRLLLIVDADCIASVKGYPYQHDALTNICIDWLAELAQKNLGWEYFTKNHAYDYYDAIFDEEADDRYKVDFNTGYMYNDFDSCTHHIRIGKSASHSIIIDYSGVASCMWCGGEERFEDEDEAESLVCESCWDTAWCAHCDNRYDRDDMYSVDGDYVCEYCYDNHTEECQVTGKLHLDFNMSNLWLSLNGGEPDWEHDESIRVYMSDLRYDSDILKEFFPKTPSDGYYVFHHTTRHWEDVYYVTVDECSDKGLALFGIENEEEIKELRKARTNSLVELANTLKEAVRPAI